MAVVMVGRAPRLRSTAPSRSGEKVIVSPPPGSALAKEMASRSDVPIPLDGSIDPSSSSASVVTTMVVGPLSKAPM